MLDPGSGNPLHRVPVIDDQGHPLFEILRGLGVFHFAEQMVSAQTLMTALEEGYIFLTPDKALVRRAVNKGGWLWQDALLHQVRPELQGHLKLGVDLQGPINGHIAIVGFGRIVELTVTGMPGTCVVPSVCALMGNVVETLHHDDVQGRIKLPEHHAESGAHDATADQHYVCLSNGHWFSP